MAKLILASSSPRRKELLSLLNIPFDIIVSDIDEVIDKKKDLRLEIERLSFMKAKAIFDYHNDDIVIGADTIVTLNDNILGKPKDIDDAKEMLKALSDKTHIVITAVTIMDKNNIDTFSISSKVTFNKLNDKEIDDYLQTNEPFDKAGAYAIQGKGAKYIKNIEGDYYAIIGLPISEVYNRLKKYMPM